MDDTPQFIKDKQLEIWLSKPIEERLRRTFEDNDALFLFVDTVKQTLSPGLVREESTKDNK